MGETPDDTSAPKHKLRWYQFSLRTLLLVVLMAGVGFGLVGRKFQQARQQRRAVDELEKLGARVVYTDVEAKWLDQWLCRLFGKNYGSVDYLALFSTSQVTDGDLVHLKGLKNLHRLMLHSTRITDAGLLHLKGLTNLRFLDLYDNQVTDIGLEHLIGLKNLQGLGLSGPELTDAGLVNFKGLTELQELGLPDTQVTGSGLVHLKGLTEIRRLDLSGTRSPMMPWYISKDSPTSST